MNLNEIAILLIELDSKTLSGLDELMQHVEKASSAAPRKVKELLSKIAKNLKAVAQSDTAKRKKLLAETGKILEEAMYLESDNGQNGSLERSKKSGAKVMSAEENKFSVPGNIDAELLAEFVTENMEYLVMAEASLLSWEKNPDDKESINNIFRAFHTIKGTAAFIELEHIKDLAHKVESMLAVIRDGKREYQKSCSELAIEAVDVLKDLLEQLKQSKPGGEIFLQPFYGELLKKLEAWEKDEPQNDPAREAQAEEVKPSFRDWLKKKNQSGDLEATTKNGRQSDEIADSTLRVKIERLDRLIDMVGELVIAQSMVAQDEAIVNGTNYDLAKKVTHTGKIVRELQDLSMYLRMVTLKATFQKMARLTRDLSQKSGKMINFLSEGGETEIDRNMVDLITDPLIHMIRNSVDHGLETPEERRQAGKSGDGFVSLRASHAEGSVILEICDDGRGLNSGLIKEKAMAKGLLEDTERLSEQELYQMIFRPGFSTAEKITDISGRGVGLDVVHKAVEALHGRIEVQSQPGKGCAFLMRLPLTMAITDGMVVRVGGQSYILPTSAIQIAVRPDASEIHTVSKRAEMFSFRDEMLPVFRLHRLFGIEGAETDLTKGLLVIIGEGLQKSALFVDDLLAQNQVVTKSLGNGMEKIAGITGGAIMGDGRVGLILDARGIINMAISERKYSENNNQTEEVSND